MNRSIIVTMAVIFAATFGLLWWQRHRAEPATARVPVSSSRAMPSLPAQVPMEEAPVAGGLRPMPAPPVRSKMLPPPVAKPAQDPPSNHDGPALPVIFQVINKSVFEKEKDAEGNMERVTRRVNRGVVINSSDQPLLITASEVNLATLDTQRTQFVLGPAMQKYIGPSDGLNMESGDQITLRAENYRDLAQQIP
jgi:hypothetical protein